MKVLLITPPFTQLNTPYPATAYLKGFLNTLSIVSRQTDLSIEVMTTLFSKQYLEIIFEHAATNKNTFDDNANRIYNLRSHYIQTVDNVISFLQGHQPTLAYKICERNYLPEASKFDNLDELDFSFGNLGIVDKAKHLATLYLEDLGDFITHQIDGHFGFNRYAESIARAASDFGVIEEELHKPNTIIVDITLKILDQQLQEYKPDVVCFTIPFPGNLFGAFKCCQWIRVHYPEIKTIAGGGYVNTELRNVMDEKVFNYFDMICLDDGELPIQCVIEYISGKRAIEKLKRTFICRQNVVQFINGAEEKDIPQRETGTPDYSDLPLNKYFSSLEITNPMHRLWSDGRWNKLTLAHGCYWGKCSFCDISLDYIGRYEAISADIICDRIETIIQQTGHNGFHFVDEAAPPALMLDLAIEILKRKLDITWWTNIRFEKSFTLDVCKILATSGCIAVTGGLEVASDRLLKMMEKGVTVEQVSKVSHNFTQSGIMVHAYLMYGFPTQTVQETIDSLEVVRQLFQSGVIKSPFWHRFAMTAHSPVGLNPEKYFVINTGPEFKGFAENDLFHEDPKGAEHDDFSEGLRISLYNYMNGVGFDMPLQKWFDIKVPKTSHAKNMIEKFIAKSDELKRNVSKVYYLGNAPVINITGDKEYTSMKFYTKNDVMDVDIPKEEAEWVYSILKNITVSKANPVMTFSEFKSSYESSTLLDFEEMMGSDLGVLLREMGLVMV